MDIQGSSATLAQTVNATGRSGSVESAATERKEVEDSQIERKEAEPSATNRGVGERVDIRA
ncbi:hypothetical protein [Kordiimonas marina]|uniref:hypothetical protein n=1 Tax=Kordiimonas marina TaxID=2872312 RepID=UPI001FF19A2E|nr:hypothetical protein [Kordiimonas marina]MCJ9428890.1 hypothetical protein [Kordiimonas marina]